jgi:hypothetical protein
MVRPRKRAQLALIGAQDRKDANENAEAKQIADWPPGVGTLLSCEGRRSVSEIFEIGGDAEVATTHELNDGLQFVFLFSGDANLEVL